MRFENVVAKFEGLLSIKFTLLPWKPESKQCVATPKESWEKRSDDLAVFSRQCLHIWFYFRIFNKKNAFHFLKYSHTSLELLTWARRGTWPSLHPLSRWATLWRRGGWTCAFHHVFSPGRATGVQTSAGNHPSPWPLHAPCRRSRHCRPAHQLTGVEKPRPR